MTTRLAIVHTTTYHYDTPVPYGLQQLRMRPRSSSAQDVVHWDVEVTGGTPQVVFEDQYANLVELVRIDPDITETTVTARGEVATTDTAGIVSRPEGHVPQWLFQRSTDLTTAGPLIHRMVGGLSAADDDVARLHSLAGRIGEDVTYDMRHTDVTTAAEAVLEAGHGVCQDHAHVFISAARLMGFPARYVSGYLLIDDEPHHEASHAWAEAWIGELGWVGFDISNGISPDERYVGVARGLDYTEAAPVSGVRYGDGQERLDVTVQVQQQ